MRTTKRSSGFALLLVLWTLVVLSAIALTLAASAGAEVRSSQDSWNDLQAERLAASGQQLAAYLETRSIGTSGEDLVGLPVQTVVRGLTYQITLDVGSIDIVFEGENGKFDLTAATEQDMAAFFTSWTGDANRGREIAAAIADWTDANDDPRPFGAESEWYLSRGYRPRNASLGMADLYLVKGLTPEDFMPAIAGSGRTVSIRPPLTDLLAVVPTGTRVNPNYASPAVLQTLPAMSAQVLAAIVTDRGRSTASNVQDLSRNTGIAGDSPLLTHLSFDRGTSPAILTIARLRSSNKTQMERRIGRMRSPSQLAVLIEHKSR
jgi:general secretion pathway protein K